MIVQSVQLTNFRNHSRTVFECSPTVNIFVGNNGEGKTNILEGLSYLCLTKSFYAASDAVVLTTGKTNFDAEAHILSENDVAYHVAVKYDQTQNTKNIFINKAAVHRPSAMVGMFPVVILSPEKNAITFGSPADRRAFIDLVISQASRSYLETAIEYRKTLKQRNKVLYEIKLRKSETNGEIDPWNEALIHFGSMLMRKRILFLKEFSPCVLDAYCKLTDTEEMPRIQYAPSFDVPEEKSEATIENLFREAIGKRFYEERKIGHSLVGPHRDECLFELNKMELRNYASQGQHKTFLIALKLAEFFYLKERCKETPILLLDDVLSELDQQRVSKLLELAGTLGQSFVTTTESNAFAQLRRQGFSPRLFYVRQGTIERVEDWISTN
ncbi:MAG TPA: DNA replication/repair protein RecF [Bacteroidota bacterium]|nr:DNA replication/repair protein RecF [Bacteroidota bacterium]